MSRGFIAIVGLIIGVVILLVVAFFLLQPEEEAPTPAVEDTPAVTETPTPWPEVRTVGTSVEERPIAVHQFGDGDTHLLFVGGIHGGYEWNSSLLAYEMIDHLSADRSRVPENLTVSIIPDANPDATYMVTGVEGRFTVADVADPTTRVADARFNANDVDLNRNFDCKWQPESTWRNNVVSAGTAPFSEPEAQAIRDFVVTESPDVAIFWHSQANNVYASECENGVLPETLNVMETYAQAAGYGEVPVFDAYPITGDVEGWLASIGIPAVTVELESFRSIEWSRNLAGTEALISNYSNIE